MFHLMFLCRQRNNFIKFYLWGIQEDMSMTEQSSITVKHLDEIFIIKYLVYPAACTQFDAQISIKLFLQTFLPGEIWPRYGRGYL